MWTVRYRPEAEAERKALDARELAALRHAVEKLQALGPQLGYPFSSDVRGAERLRELRLRRGRSRIRAFYRQVHGEFVIAAIGPEAQHNRRGFGRACRNAEERLEEEER